MSEKHFKKKTLLSNKTILITGATGSFGKFFITEALKQNPKKVIVFSRDEDKQYSIRFEYEMYLNKLEFVIGDVRDKESLVRATRGSSIDILIHAAAMKQIPTVEYNILEAVKTNVLGAQNIVDVSIEQNIPKVIGISTDKVVEPVNAYGMTKALQEKIFMLANKQVKNGTTKFSCVRYGNVINSRGSIIPLFIKQIKSNQPLTITDKRMTRFILTLSEATSLVMKALDEMKGGEIFVPKIKPLRIIDLAETLIEIYKPKNKKIVEIGVRVGEKIHETLISETEWDFTKSHKNYYVISPKFNSGSVGFKYSSDQKPFLSRSEIKDILKSDISSSF